jgi:hypothetical protein
MGRYHCGWRRHRAFSCELQTTNMQMMLQSSPMYVRTAEELTIKSGGVAAWSAVLQPVAANSAPPCASCGPNQVSQSKNETTHTEHRSEATS